MPQITNALQNAVNNFNVRQALSEWVKSKLGTENLPKKGLCQLVIMALQKILKI
jgi:hypothetical protein